MKVLVRGYFYKIGLTPSVVFVMPVPPIPNK